MGNVQVLITRLDPSIPLPKYAKGGDAGADIVSRIDITLQPGERALVPTGSDVKIAGMEIVEVSRLDQAIARVKINAD